MKGRLLAICVVIGVIGITTAHARVPQSTDSGGADAQTLRNNETQWNREYESKDLDKLVSHYADDAVLMSPGTPPAHGKAAIRSALKEMISDPAISLRFEAQRVVVAKGGDMAYTEGSYTLTMTNPATRKPINDKGSYVTVYQKQTDGSWKAVSDIATSETPPFPTAPSH